MQIGTVGVFAATHQLKGTDGGIDVQLAEIISRGNQMDLADEHFRGFTHLL